jgi:putative heme iron utilization protein
MTQEPHALSPKQVQQAYEELVGSVRVGNLLTLQDGRPFGSHVPFLPGYDWTSIYLHLSGLAHHTQNLRANPLVSVFVSEPDRPERNPLALKRLNLLGTGAPLAESAVDYARVKDAYIRKFPQSAMLFDFADFQLWELRMEQAHFVLGFGHAFGAQASNPQHWIHQRPDQQTANKGALNNP